MTKTTDALQQVLVELNNLAINGKQLHWNIRGKNFRSLHLELDEIVDLARTSYDDVAERLVALDTPADGRAATIAKNTTLDTVPEGFIATDDGFKIAEKAVIDVAEKIKSYIEPVDAEDPLTGDLLIGVARDLEKAAWMLRAQFAEVAGGKANLQQVKTA